MTDLRPRAWNSTLPVRSSGLAPSPFPQPSGPSLRRKAWLRSGSGLATVSSLPQSRPAPSSIPKDVLALVDLRDGHFCLFCGRYREVIDHHHRRIKGMDGDTAPHTECICNIVSACPAWTDSACHRLVHLKRRLLGEPRGFVVPRSTPLPGLISVQVASPEDGTVRQMWPTCNGRWADDEPEGCVA